MNRLLKQWLLPAAALLLLGAPQAKAGLINWKYNWTPSSLAINADGGSGGNVTLTNEPLGSATGSSDVVATNIRTISSAPATAPDTMITQGNYTLTVQITDIDSGLAGSLAFTGKLGGTFSNVNSNVSNKFTGTLTKQLTLGDHTFTVTIGPYTPPGPPNASNAGSIAAHVDVSDLQIEKVPEPSTMALALFGLSTVGAGWWRKRRLAA